MDKTCFVIGPIGDEGSAPRQHADWVLEGIINPALASVEMRPGVRADKIATPGMIDSQVITSVLDADLVIADLTRQNPNAFYELALRHMAEKPIIHLIHKSETKLIPFDVAPYRTVFISWDTPEEMHRSIREVKASIEAAISPDHNVENPVTRARGQQRLKETATPTEQVLMEEIQGLSARLADLERRAAIQSSNALADAAVRFVGPMQLKVAEFAGNLAGAGEFVGTPVVFNLHPPNPAAGRARGGIGGTTGGIGGTTDRSDKE
jgi:hypothetical protein